MPIGVKRGVRRDLRVIKEMPVDVLIEYVSSGKINKNKVDIISSSMKRIGFNMSLMPLPDIIYSDGYVSVDGGHRITSAYKVGLDVIPITVNVDTWYGMSDDEIINKLRKQNE